MREITITGATVDEAVELASQQLGIPADDFTYEVLELPVKKLFGQSPAKIKVTAPDATESAPAESTEFSFEEEKPLFAPRRNEASPRAERPAHTEAAPKREHVERAPRPVNTVPDEPLEEKDLPESLLSTLEYLRAVVDGMGAKDTTYSFFKTETGIKFSLDGEDSALLIGRRGETMESLQYLCTLVNSRANKEYVKLTLDISGYRRKREQSLESMAQRIGTKVQKTHRSQALPPMNPYERRIVHSAVQLIPGVTSESTGEDPNRRIVISPEGASRGHYNNSRRDGKGYGRKPSGPRPAPQSAPSTDKSATKTEKQPSADVSALYTKIEF